MEKVESLQTSSTALIAEGSTRLTGYAGKNYLKLLTLLVLVLVVYTIATLNKRSIEVTFAGWFSILAALVPITLWVRGIVPGLPVFPLFCMCYMITYGLQFLLNTENKLGVMSPSDIWGASFTFSVFVLAGTVAWAAILKFPKRVPEAVRVFTPGKGDRLLLYSLAASDLFLICANARWVPLSEGAFAIVRAFITGLSALGIFVIAFRAGAGQVSQKVKTAFVLLLILYVVSSAVNFFLVGAISALLMTSIGYALGKNAVPWGLLGVMLVSSSILHFGKFEMRIKYWPEGSQGFQVFPWDYPAIYVEWFSASMVAMTSKESKETASIYERSSLLDMLLMVRDLTPSRFPYLDGETYRLLPQVFMPRFLNSAKISTHEADTILNVYYEKQTREGTSSTTFGWGLLNESYANYGMVGVGIVGAIVGLMYGYMTRVSLFQPLLSYPTLISLTAISYAIQTESVSTYLVAALFQSLVAVTITSFVFMKKVSYKTAMEWQKL
ncbi:MAG: hypothetical protein JWN25_3553 [Verrucomicrobiales bacterium]|nr:hypothetical protein [Verrucomicrobiales bacterium]MDB6131133.1 hypothetical protein [Verrucomicrobiales bacterium]